MNDPSHSRAKHTYLEYSPQDTPMKFKTLAASHPYVQQIDIVYPSILDLDTPDALANAFKSLQTRHVQGKLSLEAVLSNLEVLTADQTTILALPTPTSSADIWCLDSRGFVTLSLDKDAYQALGVAGGKALPFRGHESTYAVNLPGPSDKSLETVLGAVKAYDKVHGAWDALCTTSSISSGSEPSIQLTSPVSVVTTPTIRTYKDIFVPIPDVRTRPPKSNKEDLEDWEIYTHELFEWVGLVGLGAQRLQVSDRSDPYISTYTSPEPSRTGAATHIQWRGFLGPQFVQSVIDVIVSHLPSLPEDGFISLTLHSYTQTPVSYIPHSQAGERSDKRPLRVPDANAEDTVSLLLCREKGIMLESVSGGDQRWG